MPDLCMTRGEPDEDIFTSPPFLRIEILSPEDTAIDVLAKVREYLAFGVEYIWTRGGHVHTRDAFQRVENGLFRAGEIEADLRKLD
jgi:hypothetical protein